MIHDEDVIVDGECGEPNEGVGSIVDGIDGVAAILQHLRP